jgi:hypothetical protein
MKDLIRAYIRSQDKPSTIDICVAFPGYKAKSVTKGIHTLENLGKIKRVIDGPVYYWVNNDKKYYTT